MTIDIARVRRLAAEARAKRGPNSILVGPFSRLGPSKISRAEKRAYATADIADAFEAAQSEDGVLACYERLQRHLAIHHKFWVEVRGRSVIPWTDEEIACLDRIAAKLEAVGFEMGAFA